MSVTQHVKGGDIPMERVRALMTDGDLAAIRDTLIFPRILVSSLKPNVGKVVLGRLGKGVAKPGQSAPWTLSAPTEDDIAVARKYDAYKATQVAAQDAPF